MLKLLSQIILKIAGWKVVGKYPGGLNKFVIVAAPHTSNWDFLYSRCALYILGIPVRFTIKKELMKFPLGPLLHALGAIPIDRSPKMGKKASMVHAMIDLFEKKDKLCVMVTPEGTRSYAKRWRTGFYHVAVGAKVPLVLCFLDYKKKHVGVGPTFHPTGNIEEDIEKIKDFYRSKTAKYPEKGVK